MRILIVTQTFPPEMGAPSSRLHPIVRQLVAAGHDVFVATGMPNYPAGVVFPAYRGKRFMREKKEGFTILRTAYFMTPRNQSKWLQLLSYLSFIPAVFYSGWRAGKLDVVFVTSPPIFVTIPGRWLARLRRARLVLDLRDLWPDEIVACGGASDGSFPIKVIRAIERQIYHAADLICCTTKSFIDTVVERGAAREKTVLIPNGADVEMFRPGLSENSTEDEYSIGNRFVVMYSGVLGIKHGLEVILETARLLRAETKIVFVLLGSGARVQALSEQAKEAGLSNVIFAGERPPSEIPRVLARADVCLSALLPDPYLKKIITVKVFEYLACEKPVVGAVAGETAAVIQNSGGGMVVPPHDAQGMADAVMQLYNDPTRRREMGRLGRRYVEENYSRSVWAVKLERKLTELCESKRQERTLSGKQRGPEGDEMIPVG